MDPPPPIPPVLTKHNQNPVKINPQKSTIFIGNSDLCVQTPAIVILWTSSTF